MRVGEHEGLLGIVTGDCALPGIGPQAAVPRSRRQRSFAGAADPNRRFAFPRLQCALVSRSATQDACAVEHRTVGVLWIDGKIIQFGTFLPEYPDMVSDR